MNAVHRLSSLAAFESLREQLPVPGLRTVAECCLDRLPEQIPVLLRAHPDGHEATLRTQEPRDPSYFVEQKWRSFETRFGEAEAHH